MLPISSQSADSKRPCDPLLSMGTSQTFKRLEFTDLARVTRPLVRGAR